MFPKTFYRVSVKALIKNSEGKILVLKENQDTWSLPGGGLDHGEDPIVGLRRELKEELNIQAISSITLLCIKTFYLKSKQTWLMWIVFDVALSSHDFTLGNGVTEAKFTHTDELKDSTDIFEKLVHEVANEKV
jgi:ADP-ribose pyrophosphatase YjhB (NUDIX family)